MTKRIVRAGKSQAPKDDKGSKANASSNFPTGGKLGASDLSEQAPDLNNLGEIECKLPVFRVVLRVIGFLLVIMLSTSLVLSDMQLHRLGPHAHSSKEIALYGILLCFNSLILVPALFEAQSAKATADFLILRTLWWRAQINWKEIIDFFNPVYLKFSVVRTRRCFYLLNKRDLSNYNLLEAAMNRQLKGTLKTKR